jgi:hypothetical protein
MATPQRIVHGEALEVLRTLPANCADAIVTDPPYELGFMGKKWDATGIAYSVELWREVLRVLKPGGHLLAFGGTRTYHRMTCAIEDAGFEIRDCVAWMYGTGFPKSLNGPWGGTALKPAHEPIVLARKPLIGTVAANVQAHGTGALNVDGCRIGLAPGDQKSEGGRFDRGDYKGQQGGVAFGKAERCGTNTDNLGRWPANVCLDEEAAALLDAQSGTLTSGNAGAPSRPRLAAGAATLARSSGMVHLATPAAPPGSSTRRRPHAKREARATRTPRSSRSRSCAGCAAW